MCVSDESLLQVLDDSCCILYYIVLYCVVYYIVGIAYVTYSKASEAALAIEKMNGQTVKGGSRHVKVSQTCIFKPRLYM